MKKLLLVMLALIAVLGICAYANPVLDTAEAAGEISLTEEAALAADLVKGVKPGLNMIGQTTSAWSFEEADGMNNVSMFEWANTVAKNPLVDDVNSSALAACRTFTSSEWPSVIFKLSEALDGARPVYVSFKYYKSYTPVAGETANVGETLNIRRNNTQYVAANIGGFGLNESWKSYSDLVVFDNAYNASNGTKNPEPVTAILLLTEVKMNQVQTGTDDSGNATYGYGKTHVYYDDISFIPSYKIEYMANDGTEEADPFAVKYALLDAEGNLLTEYSADNTVVPTRTGYKLLGWSTTADATTASETFALANEDITLYAVWEELPEKVGWDFETAESMKWWTAYDRVYRNGMMVLDNTTSTSGYTGHDDVPDVDASLYKYLVIKARSSGAVDHLKFYLGTTTNDCKEDTVAHFMLNPYSDEFTEYVVDLSSIPKWTGNYKNCMLKLNNGKGIVEIEEIYFTTDVEKRHTWSFSGSSQKGIEAWGHSSYVLEDGVAVITKIPNVTDGAITIETSGATYSNNAYTVDAAENPIVVFKTLKGKGPSSFQAYYITGSMTDITADGNIRAYKSFSDEYHDYYVGDFSSKTDYANGMVKKLMIAPSEPDTYYVDEIYLTNKAPTPTKVAGWDFEGTEIPSDFEKWGTREGAVENGRYVFTHPGSGDGGVYLKNNSLNTDEYPYVVIKQLNEGSSTVPGKMYVVAGGMTNIDEALTVDTPTANYTTPDGKYTYYIYDMSYDENPSDSYSYTGTTGNSCITTGTGVCIWEEVYYASSIDKIIAECTVKRDSYTAPASAISKEKGTIKFAPFLDYEGGYVADFTYELDNSNATITEKTDGTAVLTAQYNGDVTVTMTANTVPAKVYTHTVTITGQAPSVAVVYDANTTDTVTGMPESEIVQSWNYEGAISTQIPVREGYKFLGWSYSGSDYVQNKLVWNSDKDTVTMRAVWVPNGYEYGLFTINEGEEPAGSVYVNGDRINCADCVATGGSVIVPLTDGIGYVLVGETAYKVTADACEALDYVPAKTLPGNEARVTGNTGIRFKANVAHAMRNEGNIAEYGFVVSTEKKISDGDLLEISLVDSGDAVKGIAYSKADGIDKYLSEDDEGVIMAAVLTGVAESKANYTTTIYVRPYMVLDSGLEIYGHATSATYYDIAKTIAENMPEDAPYAAYINGIISTVEAE